MQAEDFEKIGLSRNESKIYLELIKRRQASAADLIKSSGLHRSIVYDNLDRLVEKGLISEILIGNKKNFVAEESTSIIEFLKNKKNNIESEIQLAEKMIPQVKSFMREAKFADSEAKLYKGIRGMKTVLADVLTSKETWCIGMTNESVNLLGETYWRNYNSKVKDVGMKEHFLLNSDFGDVSYFAKMKNVEWRRLPRKMDQKTELIIFDGSVAMFIYSTNPAVVVIKDDALFNTFRGQFDFLWSISEKNG